MAQGESKEAAYEDVLLQIVERLIAQIKGLDKSACFFALDPDDIGTSSGRHTYIVSPVSGEFREEAFVGAGIAALATHSGCIVKIHCPSLVDQRKRDSVAITGESIGVLRKASGVLAALAPSTAAHPPAAGWVPYVGDYALTSPFTPVGYSLSKNPNGAIRSIELTFKFEFDWDTTQQ